jgi:hypothetical protein
MPLGVLFRFKRLIQLDLVVMGFEYRVTKKHTG